MNRITTVFRSEANCQKAVQRQTQRSVVESVKVRIRGFIQEFHTIRRALRHPEVPWYAKLGAGCAALYIFSPIQLIPNFIPIFGQMDDLLVVGLTIRMLRKCIRPDVLKDCQTGSGLSSARPRNSAHFRVNLRLHRRILYRLQSSVNDPVGESHLLRITGED